MKENNRLLTVLAAGLLVVINGCAHFSTSPEAGRWQHPVVRATPEQISEALHNLQSERWQFVTWNAQAARIALSYTTPHGFIDDVILRLVTREDRTMVMIHSASRVGWYDFGQNRKHVAELILFLRRTFGLEDNEAPVHGTSPNQETGSEVPPDTNTIPEGAQRLPDNDSEVLH